MNNVKKLPQTQGLRQLPFSHQSSPERSQEGLILPTAPHTKPKEIYVVITEVPP